MKVAYLAGPNPENDLEILVKHGILPENVWAFELDKNIYNQAVMAALESKFPFIKIYQLPITSFFEIAPIKFDLIYLDMCGSLASKERKNLHTIVSLLHLHTLNSPGILITNCALPSREDDSVGWDMLSKLCTCYLYPKDFLESDEPEEHELEEGAIANGYDPDEFLEVVQDNLEFYYGQFITRLISDLASVVVPYTRFASQKISKLFFKSQEFDREREGIVKNFYHFQDVENDEKNRSVHERYRLNGDVISEAGSYPLLWTMASLYKPRNLYSMQDNLSDKNYPQFINEDLQFKEYAESFLRQLSPDISINPPGKSTVENLEKIILLCDKSLKEFYKETLIELSNKRWWEEVHLFCDVFLFHQVVELLVRQLSVPYHVNIEATTRWTYKAKQHRMFLDLIVLDECRYVYDWMPTIDMIDNGLGSLNRQLAYRFALDGMNKHRRWYNNEVFSGTAVVDQYQTGFEAKVLSPRIRIN